MPTKPGHRPPDDHAFRPRDPGFEASIRESFARQGLMKTLGATLVEVSPGEVTIALTPHEGIGQQHGYVHAGALTSIADSACGYAAGTLMPADSTVLSVEFKMNLLAPASGARVVAHGRVLRAGGTLTVCRGDVYAYDGEGDEGGRHVATMLATMIRRALAP